MERIVQYMEKMRPPIEQTLAGLLPHPEKSPAVLHEAMRYSVLGSGKRLRPVLFLLCAQTCGLPEPEPGSLAAACSLELAHTYSLIHDDLPAMDNDDLRRGRLTCHKAYGEAIAILAGDALLTLSFEVLAAHTPPARAGAACLLFAQALGHTGMVGGQVLDMESNATDGTMEQLQAIHRWKTGCLLSVSCQLGGLYAGADAEQMRALKQYGETLGLLFQITDDILDVESTSAELGKTAGKDKAQNKLTYPALVGVDAARQLARDAAVNAKAALKPFGKEASLARLLADFLVERRK